MLVDAPAYRGATHRLESPPAKAEILQETLATILYDLVRAPQFVPFSILFATGQRLEIKTREHISLGPVSRADVEETKGGDRLERYRPVAKRLHARNPQD
jgi:hypothetical protein